MAVGEATPDGEGPVEGVGLPAVGAALGGSDGASDPPSGVGSGGESTGLGVGAGVVGVEVGCSVVGTRCHGWRGPGRRRRGGRRRHDGRRRGSGRVRWRRCHRPARGGDASPSGDGAACTNQSLALSLVSRPFPAEPPGRRSMLDPAGGAGRGRRLDEGVRGVTPADRVDHRTTDDADRDRAPTCGEAAAVRDVGDRRRRTRPRSQGAGAGPVRQAGPWPTWTCA